jgi:hypothetical protein
MAADDIVSDLDEQISAGAEQDIQPSSGDEWLVKNFFFEDTGEWYLLSTDDDGHANTGRYADMADETQNDFAVVGLRPLTYLVTNTNYIRLDNGSGGTKNMGFSAIKTKE